MFMRDENRGRSGSVLLVGSARAQFERPSALLRELGYDVRFTSRYREAVIVLKRSRVDVVLCAEHLPDGGWKQLLALFAAKTVPTALIVLADDLDAASWAEATNLGAQDVLLTPLFDEDVKRSVQSAVSSCVRWYLR